MRLPAPALTLPEDDATLARLLRTARRIAVLGIKTEAQAAQPAFYVPAYLANVGYELLPVPVYFPEVQTILGRPVVRRVSALSAPVDIVDVFRRPQDLAAHLDDLLTARPALVWLQQGIRDTAFSQALRAAGIGVIEDRCLMVDHQRLIGR
jgi:predicted CoA-binding protein